MTLAKTLSFGKLIISIGDGGSPEVFAAPCGLTSDSFSLTKDLADTITPDCDDPDAVAWKIRDPVSREASIDGDGVMALQSLEAWREFFESDDPKNVRIAIDASLADGGGYWQGPFHLSTLTVKGQRGQRLTVTIKADSAGAVVWTPASS